MDHGEKNPTEKNPSKKHPPILERFRSRLKEREQMGPVRTRDVVRLYEEALANLTTNSKPVITELSMIAGVHKEHADGIATAICNRIIEVPPQQKLPALYLLDSIVKNVGHEYPMYFAARLPEIFLETYVKLNPSLLPAMSRLFKTWPAYFPLPVLSKIEVSLRENKERTCFMDVRHSESQSPHPLHGVHANAKYMDCNRSNHPDVDTRPSQSLRLYCEKSSCKHGGKDLDHHDWIHPYPGFERFGTATLGGVEDMLPHPVPLFGPKIDAFSERFVGSSSLPGSGSGGASYRNGGSARSWISGGGDRNQEDSVSYNNNNGCDELRAKFLIDAYGKKDDSKRKFQRLDCIDMSSDMGMKDSKKTEDESAWESMSPTLASPSKWYNSERFRCNAGLTRLNAAYLRKNFAHDWHDRVILHQPDGPANHISNAGGRTPGYTFQNEVPRHNEPMLQCSSSYRAQESLQFSSVFLQTSQENKTQSWERSSQLANSASGMGPSTSQPSEKLSSSHYDTSKGESPTVEGRWGHKPDHDTAITLHTVHKDQSLLLPTTSLRQSISPFDLKSSRPIANSRPSQPFLHRQPFHNDDNTQINPISSQPSGFNLKLENLLQTPNLVTESQELQERSASIVADPVSPHLLLQSSGQQVQGDVINPTSLNLLSTITSATPLSSSFHSYCPPHFPPLCSLPHDPPPPSCAPFSPPAAAAAPPLATAAASLPHAAAPIPPPPPPAALPSHHPVTHHPALPHIHVHSRPFNPDSPLPHVSISPRPLPAVPPPVVTQNNSFTFLYPPSGPLPHVPPGPLPASFQISPASESTNAAMSKSPADTYSGLISSLLAQGLISVVQANPSQDAVGIGFNAEFLKVRHESPINALYCNIARQCTTCGMRFKSQQKHSTHMDWHVTKNQISKTLKRKPSRNWYVSAKEWLSGGDARETDVLTGLFLTEPVLEKNADKEVYVAADEDQSACALCGEPFEYFYSHEMEEWLYRGAVYLNGLHEFPEGIERSMLGPIVHAKCRRQPDDCFGNT